MSLYAHCPVCPRVFRPKSLEPDACWKSVQTHVRNKAQDCAKHLRVREHIFRSPSHATCAICREVFASVKEACLHMRESEDEAHVAFREMPPEQAAHDRREAENILIRQRGLDSMLYSAAKAGNVDEVRAHLRNGAHPNGGGEDGFTPLMTSSEAGHEAVVNVLLEDVRCKINQRNNYGQTALCLAAINGHVQATLRLLQADGVDVECVGGGLSIAEKTRRAGFEVLADILSSAAKEKQVRTIVHAVMDGFASGEFDSITQRIDALSSTLAVHRASDDDEPVSAHLCAVCLCNPIETVVLPCFHACMCLECSGQMALRQAQHSCPICRVRVDGARRIFFP